VPVYNYDDGKGIATTGYGTNLAQKGARAVLAQVLREHPGGGFTAADVADEKTYQAMLTAEMNKPKAQRGRLTGDQVEALFQHYVAEREKLIVAYGIKDYHSLPQPVRAALLSAAYNSLTPFTQGVVGHINNRDYEAAAKIFERFGAKTSAGGFGGLRDRYNDIAAMLRNQC
jgi:GH24 family phage-related lysozyme (muramidase)